MIRKLITIGLPFVAPFMVYLIWWWATKRREMAAVDGRHLPSWQELPWTWLVMSGSVLLAASLILGVIFGSDPRDGVYTSPRLENGVIIPGRIER
jgi:hypothetical protein